MAGTTAEFIRKPHLWRRNTVVTTGNIIDNLIHRAWRDKPQPPRRRGEIKRKPGQRMGNNITRTWKAGKLKKRKKRLTNFDIPKESAEFRSRDRFSLHGLNHFKTIRLHHHPVIPKLRRQPKAPRMAKASARTGVKPTFFTKISGVITHPRWSRSTHPVPIFPPRESRAASTQTLTIPGPGGCHSDAGGTWYAGDSGLGGLALW